MYWGGDILVLCKTIREGLSDKVTFEQTHKGSRRVKQENIRKTVSRRGNNMCQGPEVETYAVHGTPGTKDASVGKRKCRGKQ